MQKFVQSDHTVWTHMISLHIMISSVWIRKRNCWQHETKKEHSTKKFGMKKVFLKNWNMETSNWTSCWKVSHPLFDRWCAVKNGGRLKLLNHFVSPFFSSRTKSSHALFEDSGKICHLKVYLLWQRLSWSILKWIFNHQSAGMACLVSVI
jgi:hypothetical protein